MSRVSPVKSLSELGNTRRLKKKMIAIVASAILALVAQHAWRHRAWLRPRPKRARRRCLLDAETSDEALDCALALSANLPASPDALIGHLVTVYTIFEPRQRAMQALSLEQQRLAGRGDAHEHSVCLLYTAQMIAISERAHSRHATQSCPPDHGRQPKMESPSNASRSRLRPTPPSA